MGSQVTNAGRGLVVPGVVATATAGHESERQGRIETVLGQRASADRSGARERVVSCASAHAPLRASRFRELPYPFYPFDPFFSVFPFCGASPSGGCRLARGERTKALTALDEATQTDTNGHKRIKSNRVWTMVRCEWRVVFLWLATEVTEVFDSSRKNAQLGPVRNRRSLADSACRRQLQFSTAVLSSTAIRPLRSSCSAHDPRSGDRGPGCRATVLQRPADP
jgi:hypothetical protein